MSTWQAVAGHAGGEENRRHASCKSPPSATRRSWRARTRRTSRSSSAKSSKAPTRRATAAPSPWPRRSTKRRRNWRPTSPPSPPNGRSCRPRSARPTIPSASTAGHSAAGESAGLPPRHFRPGAPRHALGDAQPGDFLRHASAAGEALKLREEVLTLSRKVLGPEHPDTLEAMGNLAIFLRHRRP